MRQDPASLLCPPLAPDQAQARFDALEHDDDKALVRACWWSWAAVLGLGVGGLLSNRPGLIGLGLMASGGVLWREHRRRCAAKPPCPVEQGLMDWIDAQDDPAARARELAGTDRHGPGVRRVAGEWLARHVKPRG